MKPDFSQNKLLYHFDRLAAWRRGEPVAPILYELSPTDACNARCRMCFCELEGRHNRFIPMEVMAALPGQLAESGAKSCFMAGEGEPLMHPGLANFCEDCADHGVETAMSSNGILFAGDQAARLLRTLTWARFTVLSFFPDNYARLHAVDGNHALVIRKNLAAACDCRARENLDIALGVQQVLFDDNLAEAEDNCRAARECGLDYFVIQPLVSRVLGLEVPVSDRACRESYQEMIDRCRQLADDNFQVLVKELLPERRRPYDRCRGFRFVSRIYSDARVYPCELYRKDETMALGDLRTASLRDIWASDRTRELLAELGGQRDFGPCQSGCRMDNTNAFLHQLVSPPAHVNFI